MTFEQEIEAISMDLRKLGQVMDKDVKRIAALGGAYFSAIAESAAPTGKKIHKRYSTAKVNKSMRAPKGSGNVVATYYPGNLARSIQVLDLKRTKNAVFVGARLQKGSATGTFNGMRADGYYMHMVEGGTRNWPEGRPFFLSSWNRSKATIEKIMLGEFIRTIDKFKAETGL